ncbi:MAG TPA: hypothetical protein VK543_11610 [Puia sp.]|nr:hypothetical protein [Puia sp.]
MKTRLQLTIILICILAIFTWSCTPKEYPQGEKRHYHSPSSTEQTESK